MTEIPAIPEPLETAKIVSEVVGKPLQVAHVNWHKTILRYYAVFFQYLAN